MTDKAWREDFDHLHEGFARLHQCMDRLETKLDAVETELDSLKTCMRDGFARIDTRLGRTADTWMVHASFGGLVLLMTVAPVNMTCTSVRNALDRVESRPAAPAITRHSARTRLPPGESPYIQICGVTMNRYGRLTSALRSTI